MTRSLLDVLVDPNRHQPFSLEDLEDRGDNINIGRLRGADSTVYEMRSGVPQFVVTEDSDQLQPRHALGFKESGSTDRASKG